MKANEHKRLLEKYTPPGVGDLEVMGVLCGEGIIVCVDYSVSVGGGPHQQNGGVGVALPSPASTLMPSPGHASTSPGHASITPPALG